MPRAYSYKTHEALSPCALFLPEVLRRVDLELLAEAERKFECLNRLCSARFSEEVTYELEKKNEKVVKRLVEEAKLNDQRLFIRFVLLTHPGMASIMKDLACTLNHPMVYAHARFIQTLYPDLFETSMSNPLYELIEYLDAQKDEYSNALLVLFYMEVVECRVNLYLYQKLKSELMMKARTQEEYSTAKVFAAYIKKYYSDWQEEKLNKAIREDLYAKMMYAGKEVSLVKILYATTHKLVRRRVLCAPNNAEFRLSNTPIRVDKHLSLVQRMELVFEKVFGNVEKMYAVRGLE